MTKFLETRRYMLILLMVFSTIGCDQVTKIAARDTLAKTGSLSFLGNSVRIVYAENPGAFLSLGAGLSQSARFWIFSAMVSAFLSVVAYQLMRSRFNLAVTIAMSLLLGGGIGNLIDRFARGRVIDFMNVGIGDLRTGIFNVADMAIVAGLLILVIEPYARKHFRHLANEPIAAMSDHKNGF